MNIKNLQLYLVTDSELSKGRELEWIVDQAVRGGVSMVQLREKSADTRTFLDLAIALKTSLSIYNIPLIINDRVDIALASSADGVHIGQNDMPYEYARKLLGPNKIIGLSVESLDDIRKANKLDLDYIGVSPVFATNTKTDTAQPFGLDGLRQAVELSKHPCVGIGGMNAHTAADVMRCGAAGIAAVSAIICAQDPKTAAAELKDILTINSCYNDN